MKAELDVSFFWFWLGFLLLHPILCASSQGFPPEVSPGLNQGKTPEAFHHHMGLKTVLKNQDICKQYCAGMIYTSRTSSVLENNTIDQNPMEGIQTNPGSGVSRDPRLLQVSRHHPQPSPGSPSWPLLAAEQLFLPPWSKHFMPGVGWRKPNPSGHCAT